MRRVAIIFCFITAMLLVVFVVIIALDDPKARVVAVQKCFDEMPNVKVTYISDLTKQASQSITAYVEVKDKGQMGFTGLSPNAFADSSHVRLHKIGPYGFRTRARENGEEGYGYAIDVGPTSPIPAARKLGITNIQSAVAHYDDLNDLVAHWPIISNEWPRNWPPKTGEWSKVSSDEIHFADLPRGDYYFCLKRSDLEVSK